MSTNKTGFNIGVLALGSLVALVGVALAGRKGVNRAFDKFEGLQAAGNGPTGKEGHAAPDLAVGGDLGPDHRAPEAFRPDIDAPMTPAEREALRPATGPSPTLVSDEGIGFQPGGDLR